MYYFIMIVLNSFWNMFANTFTIDYNNFLLKLATSNTYK